MGNRAATLDDTTVGTVDIAGWTVGSPRRTEPDQATDVSR